MKKIIRVYNAALWVMEREFKKVNRSVSEQIHKLRRGVEKEFPVIARLTIAWLGPILLWSTCREEKRLASGRTYEPPTFVKRRNWIPASQPPASWPSLAAPIPGEIPYTLTLLETCRREIAIPATTKS